MIGMTARSGSHLAFVRRAALRATRRFVAAVVALVTTAFLITGGAQAQTSFSVSNASRVLIAPPTPADPFEEINGSTVGAPVYNPCFIGTTPEHAYAVHNITISPGAFIEIPVHDFDVHVTVYTFGGFDPDSSCSNYLIHINQNVGNSTRISYTGPQDQFTVVVTSQAPDVEGTYTLRITNGTIDDSEPSTLELDLSQSSVSLDRGQAMTPVTATATGGSGSYAFSVAPDLPAGLSLNPATGTISGTPSAVSPLTTYTVTVTDTATVTGAGGPSVTDTATATLDIEVVEDGARVAQAFGDVTGAFLLRRSDRILSAEPRSWRLDQRRQAGGPGSFVMRANDDGLALRFDTATLSAGGLWHFWAEGEYSNYTDATGIAGARDGEFGLLSLGIDRLLHDRLALGVMVQVDRTGEQVAGTSDVSGNGWMVGPYLSAELREGLFLAARMGWGRTANDAMIDVYQNGSPWFAGQFDTTRSLARVALYGSHDLSGGMRIAPEVDLAWIRDRQGAYTVDDGLTTVAVPGTVVDRRRLTLAATLERDIAGQDGRLMWFARPSLFLDRESLGGVARAVTAGSLELGLRSGAGAIWQGGASLRFDGLGQTGFDAWSLRLNLHRPL